MKMVLSTLFLAAAVIMTAGLYLTIRNPQERESDIARLRGLFRPIQRPNRPLTDFLFKFLRMEPETANGHSTSEESVAVA
jgi:hypothetical protein